MTFAFLASLLLLAGCIVAAIWSVLADEGGDSFDDLGPHL